MDVLHIKHTMDPERPRKDLVVGAITGYSMPHVAAWLQSLQNVGYVGDVAMIVYNGSTEFVEQLRSIGVRVFTFVQADGNYVFPGRPVNIVVDRFLHLWTFLRAERHAYRYIVTTDVRDVIFQSNPMTWLEAHAGDGKRLNVGCESLLYRDECLFGARNMQDSFGPEIWEAMSHMMIYNAGTIAGDAGVLLDLCLAVNLVSRGGRTSNPDQAALNVLLTLEPWASITRKNTSEDGWAAQLGTTQAPQHQPYFGQKLTDPTPLLGSDGIVRTSKGVPFCLVHQYNRDPTWTTQILHRVFHK